MVPCQMSVIEIFYNQLLVNILSHFVMSLVFGPRLGSYIGLQMQIQNECFKIISSTAKFISDTNVLLYELVMKSSVRCILWKNFSL